MEPMDTVRGLAMIFGPFLAIVGLWLVCYAERVPPIVASFQHTPAVLYLHNVLNLLFGLVILSLHASWEWHASVLLTLLGWLYIVRGLLGFYWPSSLAFALSPFWYRLLGWVPLAWGLALSWLAMNISNS